MIATVESAQLEIARQLVDGGFSVIPIGRNKQPAIAWKELQSRRATHDELQAWFGVPDRHGIGIVCGEVSGNLEVIDFDLADPEDLTAAWSCFVNNVSTGRPDFPLDSLTLVKTPRGLHLYYRCESPIGGSQKLARHNGTLDPESGEFRNPSYFIETRGEGGYVLSVGSPAHCHPTGGTYKKLFGPELHELKPITAAQREVLLLEARWLGVQETAEARKEVVPSLRDHQDSSGLDFASRTSWAEILEPHGFTLVETTPEGTQNWRRPGTANPVSATTNHGGSDLFYSFSPNCGHGIEPSRGYSKFAMFTMLNHAGDFTASARALGQMGFGQSRDLSHIDLSGVLNDTPSTKKDHFGFQSFEDFMRDVEETEYLCRDVLAKGQSAIIGGPEKSLKTGIGAMDLGYSLATGTPFLGRFECPKAISVGIMTGETSRPKLQRQFKNRMEADSLLYPERPAPQLFITANLPDLSAVQQMIQIEETVGLYDLDVLIIDPAYLSLGSNADHTSNLAKMGNMLRALESVSKSTGCTLVLLHHTNRKHEPGKPLTLRDLSGAGFAEWARQWILLSPRKPFEPDTYQHCLWMVVGGSAGHAGRYAVDVREKNDEGEWAWITDVRSENDERQDYRQAKEARKEDAASRKAADFVQNLRTALNAGVKNGGSVIEELRAVFREHGWKGVKSIDTAKLEEFEANGFVYRQTITRGGNPNIVAWLPCDQWIPVTPET